MLLVKTKKYTGYIGIKKQDEFEVPHPAVDRAGIWCFGREVWKLPSKKTYKIYGQRKKAKILNEQFWFTATTIGVNSFTIATEKIHLTVVVITILGIISIMGFHLVLDRSTQYAMGKGAPHLEKPVFNPSGENYWQYIAERFKLTKSEICLCIRHMPFVLAEFGSTLFYFVLISISYISLVYVYCTQ